MINLSKKYDFLNKSLSEVCEILWKDTFLLLPKDYFLSINPIHHPKDFFLSLSLFLIPVSPDAP